MMGKYCISFSKCLEHLYSWVSLRGSGTKALWKSRYSILVLAVQRLMAPYVIYILYIFVFIQHFICAFSMSTLFFPRDNRNRTIVRCAMIMVFSFNQLGSQMCPVHGFFSGKHILHLQLLTNLAHDLGIFDHLSLLQQIP